MTRFNWSDPIDVLLYRLCTAIHPDSTHAQLLRAWRRILKGWLKKQQPKQYAPGFTILWDQIAAKTNPLAQKKQRKGKARGR